MGGLETEFLNTGVPEKLAARREGFLAIMRHLDASEAGFIVETGTARIEGNWAGDGQSTLIWDWVVRQSPSLPRFRAVSIDLDPKAVETARRQASRVEYHAADSVKTLNNLTDGIVGQTRLLYLDSFDWQPDPTVNLDSAFHHMAELAAVWARLPSGCLVVVDDRHGDGWGKHFMVEFFMEKLGISPLFKAYQIGWVKP